MLQKLKNNKISFKNFNFVEYELLEWFTLNYDISTFTLDTIHFYILYQRKECDLQFQ